MNTYRKYCPNVFVAQCEQEYQKGEVITLTTKYGKTNECIVHNLVAQKDGYFYYSITRLDGFNSQERAKNKAAKLEAWAESAENRSDNWREKSNEGAEFLSLAEPIKIGHHSEKRHRALIERNWDRMDKSMKELKSAEAYKARAEYWESLSNKIDLSMPESLEFFKAQLEEATEYHKLIKDGIIPKEHSYSLTYAKKRCNELQDKYDTAVKLWA